MIAALKKLIIPIFILITMSIYSAYSFFNLDLRLQKEKIRMFTVSDKIFSKKRKPASQLEIQKIDLNCEGLDLNKIKVNSEVISLKVLGCPSQIVPGSAKLINLTNKYVAQIFYPDLKTLATDYIQLAFGENILKIEFSLKRKQKKTQIIKIIRNPSEIQ